MLELKNYVHLLTHNKIIWAFSGLLLLVAPATGLALLQSSDGTPTASNAKATTEHSAPTNLPNSNESLGSSTSTSTSNLHSSQMSDNASLQLNIQSNNSQGLDNKAEVTINGESVPVPASGTVHKNISIDNGNVSLDVKVHNDSSASTSVSGSSSSSVHINSSTTTSTSSNDNDGGTSQRHR